MRTRQNECQLNTHSICLVRLSWLTQKTRHNALQNEDDDETECKLKCARISNDISPSPSAPLPLPPLSRSITILISRRRARVSERMRTRKRWAREGREKGEAGSRCGPFTREWGKRKIEINRLHETHTHTCVYGMCVCAHASYEKLRTGLDNDPGSEEVKASRQRQQTQIPPSCGSRWQREALRRASKRVAAYLLIMQDKVPYTHTHTHMHPPRDRICRVHGQKYKKVPLTALINWVNMSKNELMAAKEKERRSEGEGTVHCGELQHWSRRQTAKEFSPTSTCL